MKLKLDANGNAVLQEVNGVKMPVYVREDGTEAPFDAAATVQSVNARAQQSQRVEQENKDLKDKLKRFEKIEDPEAALKALSVVKNLDDKKLVDAGEVEKVKAEVAKVYEGRLAEANTKNEQLTAHLHEEVIGGAFARSKTISEKFAIPADIVRAKFGSHFKVQDGKLTALDAQGKQVFSRVKPGDPADFDEALMILVEGYPYKDAILKGTGASGSGAPAGGSGSGAGGAKKEYTRSQFDAMTPVDKAQAMRTGAVVVDG